MSAGADLPPEAGSELESSTRPSVSACRSCPERLVFIEAGNTDGWLATDLTVDVNR